jgi:hypothetical protein
MTQHGQVRYELKTPYRDGTTHVFFIGADKDFTAAYASTPTTRFLLGGLAPSNFFTDPAFLQKGWKSTCLRNAFLSIYRIKPIPNAIKS